MKQGLTVFLFNIWLKLPVRQLDIRMLFICNSIISSLSILVDNLYKIFA